MKYLPRPLSTKEIDVLMRQFPNYLYKIVWIGNVIEVQIPPHDEVIFSAVKSSDVDAWVVKAVDGLLVRNVHQ